jgi:hypothetical protein
MIAAPLVAIAETNPRSIRSISSGPSPVLMTCAPIPHTMPASVRRASRNAATMVLNAAPARISGIESRSAATGPPGETGRAKSSTRALLARDFSG